MKTNAVVITSIFLIILVAWGYFFYSNSMINSEENMVMSNSEVNDTSENNIEPSDVSAGSETLNPETKMIEIKNFDYSPSELRIKAGDSIEWTNLDNAGHTVTSDSGKELDSGLLSKGKTYSHTFASAGTYEYHCAPHPYMKGKIIVE